MPPAPPSSDGPPVAAAPDHHDDDPTAIAVRCVHTAAHAQVRVRVLGTCRDGTTHRAASRVPLCRSRAALPSEPITIAWTQASLGVKVNDVFAYRRCIKDEHGQPAMDYFWLQVAAFGTCGLECYDAGDRHFPLRKGLEPPSDDEEEGEPDGFIGWGDMKFAITHQTTLKECLLKQAKRKDREFNRAMREQEDMREEIKKRMAGHAFAGAQAEEEEDAEAEEEEARAAAPASPTPTDVVAPPMDVEDDEISPAVEVRVLTLTPQTAQISASCCVLTGWGDGSGRTRAARRQRSPICRCRHRPCRARAARRRRSLTTLCRRRR